MSNANGQAAITDKQLSHPKYRADIDGLRAIAVLVVVGFHAFPGWMKGGFIGVDIFFVISGFLISSIIFESLDNNKFSFIDFYSRRVKRIFPALLLVLLASLVFGWYALLADEYKQLGKHVAAGTGFVSNFVLWNEDGYFDSAADLKPLLHLWSLGIEEQFYIFWPLLLWAAWRKYVNILTTIVLVAAVSFYFNVNGVSKDAIATFYSPLTRFWELLAGSLLAWLALYKRPFFSKLSQKLDCWLTVLIYSIPPTKPRRLAANAQSLLGAALIAASVLTITKENVFPGWWAVMPVLGTVLLISAGLDSWVNRVVLSNKLLVWFGLISFPLYLWHWPLLSFARIIEGDVPSRNIRIAVVFISILLAWFTYILLEKPIRFSRNSHTKTAVLVALMFVTGGVGYTVYKQEGFAFRLSGLSEVAKIISNPLPPSETFDCKDILPEFSGLVFDGGCRLTKKSMPEIAFIGDSHALHYRSSVPKKFDGHSVMMVSQTSCLPFSINELITADCKKNSDALVSFLKLNTSIKKVYLSGHWGYLMTGGFESSGVNWRMVKPIDASRLAGFKGNAAHFISSIAGSGKSVVLIKDAPDLDFDIESCYDARPLRLFATTEIRSDCTISYSGYRKRTAVYDDVMDKLLEGFPLVKVYDPTPLFCRGEKCFSSDGFLPYYYNGDHLNWYGADMVLNDLIEKGYAN